MSLHNAPFLTRLQHLFLPYTTRVYFVGGCVRDTYLQKTPYDYDIEVYGVSYECFESLMKELHAFGVGKSFFVYKWECYDIALGRTENKISSGHTGFQVSIAEDEKEGSSRRDFTVNALMVNIFSFHLLDFWDGLSHIRLRRLCMINEEKYQEDPLRALRAVQLSARLGFRIEQKTLHVSSQLNLLELTHERISRELEKLFMGDYPHYGLYALQAMTLDKKIFGITLTSRDIYQISVNIIRSRRFTSLKSYSFLYWLASLKKISLKKFFQSYSFGKSTERFFKNYPLFPKNVTERYIAAIATKGALKEWVGLSSQPLYDLSCAKKWYSKPLFFPFSSRNALDLGLKDKHIGQWLRQQRLDFLRQFSKKKIDIFL